MANEKRLIDANALLEFALNRYGQTLVPSDIKNFPTVDAVGVAQGHWEIRPHPFRTFCIEFYCSACGGWKHMLAYKHENMNYCPNCGAKMDLK